MGDDLDTVSRGELRAAVNRVGDGQRCPSGTSPQRWHALLLDEVRFRRALFAAEMADDLLLHLGEQEYRQKHANNPAGIILVYRTGAPIVALLLIDPRSKSQHRALVLAATRALPSTVRLSGGRGGKCACEAIAPTGTLTRRTSAGRNEESHGVSIAWAALACHDS